MRSLALPGRTASRTAAQAAERLQRLGFALIVPLLLLLMWTVAARHGWMPPQILPAPDVVGATIVDLWRSGDLLSNTAISLQRVVEGFALGATCGFVLGLAMGLSPDVEAFVRPLFTAVSQVPALGWIPLLMLLLGIGEPLKIIVIARAAGVPVALNTLAGVRAVPPQLIEVGRIFRFRRLQMLRHVVLPAAVPPMFTGIRYGLTHAWTALVAVELLASSEGLGYLLIWGQQMFQLDEVIAAMAAIGLIGYAMDYGLARIEAHLQRWRPVSVQAGAA